MALTTLSGLVDDNLINQSERVVDMDDVIAMLDPDVSQFTTILMRVAKKAAQSTKVEWLEDQLFPRLSSVASGGASDGATITVNAGEGAYFRAGDIVRNAHTGVAFKVVSVATDTLTITNHLGRVAFAAHTAADQLLIVGNAAAQGATLGTRKITKMVNQYNYCQIQRNPYGFTRSLMASKLYGGPEPMVERKKKATEHKRAIEYTLFWGARNLDTSGANPNGQAGGLFEYITTNVKNAAGSLTKVLLDQYMKDFLQHGNQNGILFVSPVVAGAISGFLRDAWQPTGDAGQVRLWGAHVDGFISGSYGFQVPVITKRDWNDFSTASSQYGGWAFYVNLDNMELHTLRDTALLQDRQGNDADEYDEEYLTEFAPVVKQEPTHGLITGVTG
jgi:Family of unknown function (DUF5309)